jgi:hypothetical protein
MFHKLDDATVLLRRNGLFRDAKLWHRKGVLFAEHGASLVRLHTEGYTSAKHVRWEEIAGVEYGGAAGSTKLVRVIPSHEEVRPILKRA